MHPDALSEGPRPASSYIVLPHGGRAPQPTASRVPYPGGDAVRRGRPETPPLAPTASPAASHRDPAHEPPPLWPGFDVHHPGRHADAWWHLWTLVADCPVRWATARAVLVEAHGIATKTADELIRQAANNGHLVKRGGYSHRHHRDTRTIERRETP